MTLPDERYRAVVMAERFLRDLTDCRETPRVPLAVRARARSVLRHFPTEYDMDRLAERSPDIVARDMEAVHRWVLTAAESYTADKEDSRAK